MKLVLVGLLALGMTGCDWFKKTGCSVAKRASEVVSAEVATQLGCKNVSAIEALIEQQLVEKIKVCEIGALGVIGEVVCPPLVSGLLNGAISQIPAEWECSGGPAKEGLKDILLNVCKKSF